MEIIGVLSHDLTKGIKERSLWNNYNQLSESVLNLENSKVADSDGLIQLSNDLGNSLGKRFK